MTQNIDNRTEWAPKTAPDRRLVLDHLDLITKSLPFRNSKRYPSFLRYAVERTLAAETHKLRERHLGVELFQRHPDYDTNADPIVRVTAGEIRKRLAQYYEREGKDDRLSLEFPPGGYVVHFYMRADTDAITTRPTNVIPLPASLTTVASASQLDIQGAADEPVVPNIRYHRVWAYIIGVVAISALAIGWAWYRSTNLGIWSNFLSGANDTVLVVVGQPTTGAADSTASVSQNDLRKIPRSIFPGDLTSSIALCNFVAHHGKKCALKQSLSVDLATLQDETTIFVGGYNNSWVLQITQPLPFRFGPNACDCIVDGKGGQTVGRVDFALPVDEISKDYSIVARLHSDVTDRDVFVIAGIGQMSTEAAANFVTSTAGLAYLKTFTPHGWKGLNMEAVLATDVTNGHPGHTQVLRTSFW